MLSIGIEIASIVLQHKNKKILKIRKKINGKKQYFLFFIITRQVYYY